MKKVMPGRVLMCCMWTTGLPLPRNAAIRFAACAAAASGACSAIAPPGK
jgi:hypothetical protein